MNHKNNLLNYLIYQSYRIAQVLLLVLFLTLSSNAVFAKSESDSPKEQWYQINLLVFQHLKGKTQGADAEQWPRLVELGYPKKTTYLRDTSKQPGNPLIDLPQNYSLMDAPESGFVQANRNIRRSAGFRTLFYKQWRQKLGTGVTGQPIAISGGKSFGEHQQLEGWVRFSQKRYLHLEVDLWLHEYEKSLQRMGIQTSDVPLPIPEQEQLLEKLFDFKLDALPTIGQQNANAAQSANKLFVDKPETQPLPFYIRKPQRIITYVMNQKRRMKSKELHYLDHPLLGVLVEAIPYESEQFEKLDEKTALWLRPAASKQSRTED
ncbi:MAG: CsiV family protein [Pseudomonadales bacterium]|nr:CsiV family protein [Pseudomonadales bacterium]